MLCFNKLHLSVLSTLFKKERKKCTNIAQALKKCTNSAQVNLPHLNIDSPTNGIIW